jgi:hypothetical protein
MLSLNQAPCVTDIGSLAHTLLGDDIDLTPLPAPSEQAVSVQTLANYINDYSPAEEAEEPCPSVATDSQVHSEQIHYEDVPDNDQSPPHIIDNGNEDEIHGTAWYHGSQEESIHCQVGILRETSLPLLKRKTLSTGNPAKKKKTSNSHESQPQLAIYLSEENRRCIVTGSPLPHETFFTPAIQTQIRELGKEKEYILAKMLLYIASPHSIAALRETLRTWRAQGEYNTWHLMDETSLAERFSLIERLDQHVSYFQLLKRYHVLELYKASGGPASRSRSGLVLITSHTFEQAAKKAGNPANTAEAEVTTKMMKDIFSDVQPSTDLYKTKYRIVTRLRKLGQRLHTLETKFGIGILGLMPDHNLTGQCEIGISDNM